MLCLSYFAYPDQCPSWHRHHNSPSFVQTPRLLLLLLLLASGPVRVASVRMLSLQADTWLPPSAEIFARHNFTSRASLPALSSFSICYRIKLMLLRPSYNTHLSTAMSPSVTNQFVFGMAGHYSLYYNNKYQNVNENVTIPFRLMRWTHFCHVAANGHYTLYIDAVKAAEGDLTGESAMKFNGTLILGQEQDAYSGGFDAKQSLSGFIAQMNIFDEALSPHEVANLNLCTENRLGNVFSLDESDMEVFGGTLSEVPLKELCGKNKNVVIFPQELTLGQSVTFCEQVGGSLYLPESLDETNYLYNTSTMFFDVCNPSDYSYLWLAGTDEKKEKEWHHTVTGQKIQDTFFEKGQPNGGTNENCITMSKISGKWVDFPCTVDKRHCFSCQMSPLRPLYLRGLCELTKDRTSGLILGYVDGFPYFQGLFQYIIYKSPNTSWTLFDSVSNRIVARIAVEIKTAFPIGRHLWYIQSGICEFSPGDSVEFSLSPCDDTKYMCDNGFCIDREARCDLKDDCPDHSDEGGCAQVRLSQGYHKHQPPRNFEKDKPLMIQTDVDIQRFSTVNDVERLVALEMQIELLWSDTRIEFLNSRWSQEANLMSKKEAQTIWRPELRFLNVKDGDIKKLDEETLLRRLDDPLPQDFNSVATDFVFSGESGLLVKRMYFSGTFACSFEVFVYPFDLQTCSVEFKLSGMNRKLVAFDEGNSSSWYSGDLLLSAYMVTKTFFKVPRGDDTSNSVFEVHFTMERRFGLLILTMLVPTLMLVTIGYSTLYVSVTLTQVRLVVSLTTLLVMYTLYNQTAATLPATAYVKMIDIWFFSCIFLLFIIIIFHVIIEFFRDQETTKVIKISPISNMIDINPVSSCQGRWTAQKINSTLRVWVIPSLFGGFMTVFWSYMVASW